MGLLARAILEPAFAFLFVLAPSRFQFAFGWVFKVNSFNHDCSEAELF